MVSSNKASDFLERNSVEGKIHVQAALIEMWARQQNIVSMLEELKEGMAGYAAYMEKMDDRLAKLEPKIQIVSEGEAKSFLGGLK